MTPGIYILTVKNVAGDLRLKSGAHLQPVRVSYKNFPGMHARIDITKNFTSRGLDQVDMNVIMSGE